MYNVVLNEVMKELNFKERIIVRVFIKTFCKIYRKGMLDCFNFYNKS